jgi:hypothetical protein
MNFLIGAFWIGVFVFCITRLVVLFLPDDFYFFRKL